MTRQAILVDPIFGGQAAVDDAELCEEANVGHLPVLRINRNLFLAQRNNSEQFQQRLSQVFDSALREIP